MKAMKTLFLWLLMSLIPLQGMAANVLLVCKAANQTSVASHAVPSTETHVHPCGGMQAVQDEAPQEGDATCLAQYVGLPWLPVRNSSLTSWEMMSEAIVFTDFHILSFIPEGPERPPRRLSL